jgi:hypothetical protein
VIELKDKESGAVIGSITPEQLKFLVDKLEEESSDDKDYYLNTTTLDALANGGIDPELLKLLRGALGDREDMEIEWSGA